MTMDNNNTDGACTFKLRLMSINVNGIHGYEKRKKVLNWLVKKHSDIYFIQETYIQKSFEKYFKVQWKGDMFLAPGTNHSKGVAILIKNNVEYELVSSHIDNDGRYVILEMKIQDKLFMLVNIYAPCSSTQDQLPFYNKLKDILLDVCTDDHYVVVGGDLNIIMNPAMDRQGGNPKQNQAVLDTVAEIMESLDIIDIWRVRNPYLRQFTWRKTNPLIQSRLDYWLISNSLQDWVERAEINPAISSDHSSIHVNFESGDAGKHGPSYWKFNDSLCNDSSYKEFLHQELSNWSNKYSDIDDKRLFWELIKFETRSFTQKYCKCKAKERNEEVRKLESKLKEAENQLDMNPTEENKTVWENVKAELNEYYEYVTKGIIVRSRANWVEKGEKSNKFFLGLEKGNKGKSTIRCLLNDKDEECRDQKNILDEIKKFYSSLYSKKNVDLNLPSSKRFLESDSIPKLSGDDQESCEGELKYDECYKVLQSMPNGKSPGNDGLTVLFYKTFWADYGKLLVDSLNASYSKGELTNSQKQGVITLILKKARDKRKVSNYRPITLLNVDLKIGSKTIANRIAGVASKLIGDYQTAFVKGRYIGDAVRTIADVMYFTKERNIPAILLCIDFEKAYDSVDHEFLCSVLSSFNFGRSMQNWIKMFYNDISSCVMNNGMSSGYFPIRRGLRQGDALSCQLFNLVIEVLCIQFKEREDIKGIRVSDQTHVKLSCYADDLSVFVQDVESAIKVMEVLKEFQLCSSMKVNETKSEAMWLGGTRNQTGNPINVKWTSTVKILGIYFTYDENEMLNLNYNEKFKSLQNIINVWKQRDLTALGKITIIKTFGLAKFMYTSTMIGMPISVQKKINKIIYNFIWKGPDRIKRTVLCKDLDEGGMKMVDLKFKVKAQSIMWLKRLIMPYDAGWKHILLFYLKRVGGIDVLKCNFNHQHLPTTIPPFYLNALKTWSELSSDEPLNATEACSQRVWNNRFILCGNKSIYYSKFAEAGFHTIYDFIDDQGKFKKFDDVHANTELNNVDFIKWCGLVNAIPKTWRTWIRDAGSNISQPVDLPVGVNLNSGFITLTNLKSKDLYLHYLGESKVVPVSQGFLSRIYNLSDEECKTIYSMPFKVTLDSKLRWLQYRITHKILPTNSWLCKIKVLESNLCNLCNQEEETLDHLFTTCMVTNGLWEEIQVNLSFIPHLNSFNKMYGVYDDNSEYLNLVNQILLIARRYIYRCRCDGSTLSFNAFKNMVVSTRKLEYYCAQRLLKLNIHFKKWEPLESWN